MTVVGFILSWLFAVIFGVLTVSFFLMGNWPQALVLLGLTLILVPPVRVWLQQGVGKSIPWWGWVGASEGGFIGTNYALYHPERVEKLALLGPMGYSGALKSSLRIMFAQFFPFKPIQESTFSWAFSDSAKLKEEFGEWFRLLMTGYNPAKVIPLSFSAKERQSLQVPVLFVFGERDNLVGDPEAARALVQDIPDVRVEVVEAGHLMGGEKPEKVSALILEFFE